MLRLARSLAAVRYVSTVPGRAYALRPVDPSEKLEKREKTMEDKNVRDHETALMNDLVRQLERKNQQLAAAEKRLKEHGDSGAGLADSDAIHLETDDKLLALRRDLLGEIRELDDRLSTLEFRLKRAEKRLGL